ncbi:MAG: hypothetical protein GC182_19980 [Rhodopseudomonas sp.]|nr:hypothetical protein [Rhodopseudomonas sp.]
MSDDIVFCARTGRQIVSPASEAKSNVIPFSRGRAAVSKRRKSGDFVEQVTIACSATLEDIDAAANAEVAALADRFDESDDI